MFGLRRGSVTYLVFLSCPVVLRMRLCTLCRVYAELAMHYMLRIAHSLLNRPLNKSAEEELAKEALPPPVGNAPPGWLEHNPALMSRAFHTLVTHLYPKEPCFNLLLPFPSIPR